MEEIKKFIKELHESRENEEGYDKSIMKFIEDLNYNIQYLGLEKCEMLQIIKLLYR